MWYNIANGGASAYLMDSNYNLEGLVGRIKARLKDADFSDEDIVQFINDAYFDILGEAHYQFLEKRYRATTQESGVLLLPRDFQTIIHLTATKDKSRWPVRYLDDRDFFNFKKDAGVKNFTYTIFGNELYYALPNISDSEDVDGNEQFFTLDLFYLAKPLVLAADTDKPIIPAEFGEALVLGALSRAEQLRDNFDYAQIYENKKEDIVLNMKMRYCPRQLEGENRAHLPVFQRLRH